MSDKTVSDEELVARCKTELPYQAKSFEILLQRYKDKVFSKAVSILKNEEDSRDISQDIFIKVFNGLPSFRSESAFSTWLYAITVNTCLNHKEKMQRRPWWWLAEDIEEVREGHVQEEEFFHLVGKIFEQEDLRKQIDSTLKNLSEQDREILELRFFEELDYKAISRNLGIGLSAVKMRLKRARQEFKHEFKHLSKFSQ